MSIKKDLVINNLKVIDKNEVYDNWSALSVNGGAVIKKGLKIGFQANPVNGLVSFDNDNLLSFSDKYGWDILNNRNFFSEILFPDEFKQNSKNVIKETDKKEILNLDLTIDDLKLFYFKIPDDASKIDEIVFNINMINNHNNIIKIFIINESTNDSIIINFNNSFKIYYIEQYNNIINKEDNCELILNIFDDKIFVKKYKYFIRN